MVAGLTVLGRTSKIFVATLMSSIATFTVGIILVWKAEILGAALGVVVTGVISGCFILYFYKASMREVDGDVKTA
jgi:O-antigen/teichoic acid export membrane protein